MSQNNRNQFIALEKNADSKLLYPIKAQTQKLPDKEKTEIIYFDNLLKKS